MTQALLPDRTQVTDGVDNATVIPRGTVPDSTDKGLAVVTLNQPRPAYQVVTTEVTSGTAAAIANTLHLWHPSTLLKDVFILEIGVNYGQINTAGRFTWEISFTSAIGTGGATVTAQQLNNGDPASGVTAQQLPTGGATLKGQIFQRAAQLPATTTQPMITNYDGTVVYRAKDLDDYSDAILLRNGQAEGLLTRQNILGTLTGSPIFSVYARWVERA